MATRKTYTTSHSTSTVTPDKPVAADPGYPENPKDGEVHGDHKYDAATNSWVWKDERVKQAAWDASQKDKSEKSEKA